MPGPQEKASCVPCQPAQNLKAFQLGKYLQSAEGKVKYIFNICIYIHFYLQLFALQLLICINLPLKTEVLEGKSELYLLEFHC